MGVVDQPVEDAIGGGGIADLFVPMGHEVTALGFARGLVAEDGAVARQHRHR
jgi:hypothetical protein